MLLAAVLICSSLIADMVSAHSYKLGDIAVGHVWAPPPEPGAEGLAVYGPILNRGNDAVRLVGASTSAAKQVRIRRISDGEVAWPTGIILIPGKPFALAPWREHYWISNLSRPLVEGDSFPLTLDFGTDGQLTVTVVVEHAQGD